MNKFNVGKYLDRNLESPRLFLVAIAVLIVGLVFSTPVYADMSVNGFFSSDYVKTGVFDEKSAASSADAQVVAVSTQQIAGSRKPQRKVKRIRKYPGRFSKTTKGTNRHQVENNEWDVGSR